MSNLSDKTDFRALVIIAQMVKDFEKLHYLDMTKLDAFDVSLARGLLEKVIECNGYKVNYQRNSKESILKS